MAVTTSDWKMVLSAMTDRLQAFARGALALSAATPEDAKLQLKVLALARALALKLTWKILLPGPPALLQPPANLIAKTIKRNLCEQLFAANAYSCSATRIN
jgi:hypothetical protein